jgi:hypothetical protein
MVIPILLSFFNDFLEFLEEADSRDFLDPISSLLRKLSWLQEPSDSLCFSKANSISVNFREGLSDCLTYADFSTFLVRLLTIVDYLGFFYLLLERELVDFLERGGREDGALTLFCELVKS